MTEKIGQYDIVEEVGAGGMATVYKAYQSKLDRHVAIKVMHDMFVREPDFLARFEREARIVARLDHPNIVPVYDYDEHEKRPYLVMKYVNGMTLKDILRKSALSSTDALHVIENVAQALSYAHDQGVLHRDIKPSNIILDRRTTPYLMDFGLARLAQAGESTISIDTLLGTPHYISPEQAQGSLQLDARTDVYSLGVVLYELVTGRVPFSAESSHAIIHDHIYTQPPRPRSINPDISPELERVLLKALSKEPDDRYPSATALAEAYREAVEGQQPIAPPQQQTAQPRTPNPPQPPPNERIPSPMGDDFKNTVSDVLGTAGQSLKQTFDEVGESIRTQSEQQQQNQNPWQRYSWRPGTSWATNARGEQGFFTPEELAQAESELSIEDRARLRVEKRMEERNAFYGHLTSYIVVNLLMWFIWLSTGADGHPWPIWVTGPWGIGMISHAIAYYSQYGPGRERREAEIRREVERERERLYGKAKNEQLRDDAGRNIRLTEDGELTDSFVDEYYEESKRKNE